ncbi:hypothetical protein C9J41_03470 [Photobacterium sp. GB-50]|nr:hypothetical protein C9J42_19375 [Photobacterium sp. GB-56]PSV39895.1 hypothetical protein C9J38_05050 [Photobacterium sp. GB-210]PSV47033.1 hypothetical protein C9J46_02000 [Photobacterium sp. GB-36]PSW74766.1 hypothetical protein C9J41_03470 [Photobacterium sp. GB-50]
MPLLNSPYWFGGVCHDIIASSKHRGLLNLFFESDRFILASFFFIKRLGYKKIPYTSLEESSITF